MLKCDVCKKHEAVIFLRQVNAEAAQEIHLCLDCAKERGFQPASNAEEAIQFSLAQLLTHLFAHVVQNTDQARRCPVCGRNLHQIKKTHTLGCPECYEYFFDDIRQIQERAGIHGAYTGSLPSRLGPNKAALNDRVQYQSQLEESLATENYEKAAFYRDKLRELACADDCTVSGGV